jgi:hypothetical protein
MVLVCLGSRKHGVHDPPRRVSVEVLCAMFGKVGTHTRGQTSGCILSRLAMGCQPMGWEQLIANRCLSYRCLPYSNATLWCPPCPRWAIDYPNHIGCLIGQSDWACNLSADHGWVLTSSNMSHRTSTRRAGARWEFVGGSGYPPVITRRVACPIRLANETANIVWVLDRSLMSSLNSTRQRLQVSFGFVSFGFVVLCLSWVVYQAPPLCWAAS